MKLLLFSENDISFIKQYYNSHGSKYCARKLNKTRKQICKKASGLKLKVNKKLLVKNDPELLRNLQERAKKIFQPLNEANKLVLDKDKLTLLYNEGKSIKEISIIYKCSTHPIKKILVDVLKRKPGQSSKHRSKNQYGSNNASWKGGIKDIYNRFRDLSKYYEWRKEVLNRDNNKCTSCSETNKLHVHHIKTLKSLIWEYSLEVNKLLSELTYEDLISDFFYTISNGLTLCEICHKKWHKENGR